jgi:hypothetical protein
MRNKLKEKDIKDMIWDNIPTETHLRKWKRRLLVALTDEEIERCKYFIRHYSNRRK